MLCILCLTIPEKLINIFEEDGVRLNVSSIITKYFWLRPSPDCDNAKAICFSCWNALHSFHQFYEKVEETHDMLINIKPTVEVELRESPVPEIIATDVSSGFMAEDIKVEITDDSSVHLPQVNEERIMDPLEAIGKSDVTVKDIKSDSESEMPLSLFVKYRKPTKVLKVKDSYSTSVVKKINRKRKITEEGSETELIKNWQFTSYSEETNRRVSSKEFDEFIKQNMELSCSICQVPLADFVVLQEHYQQVHHERGYIACCDKKFDKRGALVDHILLHKYPEYFKCEKCAKTLGNRKNLKEHMNIHDKKSIYQCDKCSKSFHRKILLDRHMDIHVSERKFKCGECDKLFVSKFSLGQHMYGVHKRGYTKICEQCGKVSRDLEAFRRHQLDHTDAPKPFVKCEKCGVKLANKSGLRRHLKSQHAENQITHVCNVCGITKASIYALKRHITYMHRYERSHKCPMCDKAFKRALTLKPNPDCDKAKAICSSCWDALHSFHQFYEKVEETHDMLINIKPTVEVELRESPVPEIIATDVSSGFMVADIKVEITDDSSVYLPQLNEERIMDPLEAIAKSDVTVKDIKSDSESEMPLSLLVKHRKPTKVLKVAVKDSYTTSVVKKINRKRKITEEGRDTELIKNWQFTSYSQETNRRVSSKEFDEFIKQNMELSCSICQVPLADFVVLQGHYQQVHHERGYISCCDKKFYKRGVLVDHILLHKYPEYFKCEKCAKTLGNRKILKEHMNIHDKKFIYQCDKCSKSFHRKILLDRHMDIHVSERKFKCGECDKLFVSKFSLGQHMYGVHKRGYTKICEQCGKVSRDLEAFRRHQLDHTDAPKPFVKCEKCGVKLANKSGLRMHLKSQHPENQITHVCNVCGITAASIYALKRHITFMHRYERSHKCPMCDKAFKRALTLKVSQVFNHIEVESKGTTIGFHLVLAHLASDGHKK